MSDRENQDLLRNQLLQLIPSGVGVYDVSENAVRKEYLNDGYFQMIEAPRDDRHQYDGTNTVNAIYPDDVPGLLTETRRSIREKRMLRYTFRVLDGRGEYRWLAIRANHVPLDEKTERFYAAYYDIDELVRVQDKLRENEMAFNDILTNSESSYFIYYPGKRRYEMAVIPEQMKELPKQMEDYPESFIRYTGMQEDDAERYRAMVRKIDAGEQEAECTVQMRYQGVYAWYRVHLLNFLDSSGRTVKAVGSAVNIDRYKKAEIAFREEKLRMKSLESGILVAACFSVSGDRNMEFNRNAMLPETDSEPAALAEAAEAEPETKKQNPETLKVLLRSAGQIPDPEQRKRFIRMCSHAGMTRLYESGCREKTLEYRRLTKLGLIWVSTRLVILQDPETGEVLAFYYTTDINERKIRQEAAARLVSNNYVTAAYVDLSTRKVCWLRGENDAPREDLDFDCANLKNIPMYVWKEDRERCEREFTLDNILRKLETAPAWSVGYRQVDDSMPPERPYRHMRVTAFYLDGEKRYLVFSRSDVTDQYEQERRQREKLAETARRAEKANLAKTDFLSRMSHDIRTPLSGIIGMTELARTETEPDALRRYLDKIDESGHFLLSLVNDILDMNRVESGKIELHPGSYSYAEFRRYLNSVVQPLCDSKSITFTFEVPAYTCTLLVDQLRFNQIFFNLLSNAVKFTPRGGNVLFAVRNQQICDRVLESDFIVRDNGIGMSGEFQKKMFEPFEQEYTGVSASRSGSGLGLAIVKSMVDLMQGTISVKSSPGEGSTFTVHLVLPVVEEEPKKDGEETPRSTLSGKRILVAEDNVINGEIVMRLLMKEGASVVLAADGAQALKQYRDSEQYWFDAVLMDMRMPVMDGLQATAAIRALDRPDAKTVPIAALTANAFEEDVEACLAAGMNAHIAKPIEPRQLFQKLSGLLGGED